MEKIDKILKHDLFLTHMQRNKLAEQGRRFCKHNIGHFLDVARIGYLINLEERLGVEKEMIYAAALLHDLGKHRQYEDGTPHEITGAAIAREILEDCGFQENEIDEITDAILSHRDSGVKELKNLQGILYRADKASRACFCCEAEAECSWGDEKKNQTIFL